MTRPAPRSHHINVIAGHDTVGEPEASATGSGRITGDGEMPRRPSRRRVAWAYLGCSEIIPAAKSPAIASLPWAAGLTWALAR